MATTYIGTVRIGAFSNFELCEALNPQKRPVITERII